MSCCYAIATTSVCVVVHYLVRQLVIVPWVSVNSVCVSVGVHVCVCMVQVCAWCVCVHGVCVCTSMCATEEYQHTICTGNE